MPNQFSNFIIWLKTPVKIWRNKRDRDEEIRRLEARQKAEEDKQKVEKQAYLLWEADGKPEGKDNYYWQLATDKIKGKNVPIIYRPYYLLEKHILEPSDAWIDKQAFFAILGKLGNLAIVVAIITFVFGENIRRNNEVFAAWTTITTAHGQSGSGGRIKALQFLNSRPWRFPWIGWTDKDWFWDENKQECVEKRLLGRRWPRDPLAGLSAPNNAYLAGIHLCGANLLRANLQDADLRDANLQDANLLGANLQDAHLWSANLQDAHLWSANLQGADLLGANLQDAGLLGANLQDAFLLGANLQDAGLLGANLQDAHLRDANLQGAFLLRANLQGADLRDAGNLTRKQIKSACNWEQALYKAKWEREKKILEAIEPDNSDYIKELEEDTASNPEEKPDCSRWEK